MEGVDATWGAGPVPRDVLGPVAPAPGEPAFDDHHPPRLDLIADCVHCGFCLPTLPHLRAVGRGDGLAPRPDPSDDAGPGRRADDRLDGAAHRPVPGLHGLCHRVPLRRTVRPADRGHPPAGRAPAHPLGARARPAVRHLPALPVPAAAAVAARTAAGVPGQRAAAPRRAQRPAPPAGAHPGHAGLARTPATARAATASQGPGARTAPGCRRHAHRLRAERVLPRRQRGDRPDPRRRGLRRAHPPGAGLLRCAECAQRPGGRGAAVRPEADRHLRTHRHRPLRRQRRGLRIVAEGVRHPAARRPRVRRTGRRVHGEGARPVRGAHRARPGRAPSSVAGHRRLPRRLPPRSRPGRTRAAPQAVG